MQGISWEKPDGDDLVPEFVRETTGFIMAFAVYFGLPVLAAFLMMHGPRFDFASLMRSYHGVLHNIFTQQNLFYLAHLGPALLLRYVLLRKNLQGNAALGVSLLLSIVAVGIFYPFKALVAPKGLQNIYLYVALYPLLMTFFTLRIRRLRFSGFVVFAVFLLFLCFGVYNSGYVPLRNLL